MKTIQITLVILELLLLLKCIQWARYGWNNTQSADSFEKYIGGWVIGIITYVALAFTISGIINN